MPRLAAVLLLASLATPAAAQLPLDAHIDALLTGTHRWRGIPRAHGLNAQLEAAARLGRRRTGLSAGVWTNFELGAHGKGGLTDLRAGHWGLSETDFWSELAHRFTAGEVAAGFAWYQYRGRAGAMGTGELYARFRGSGVGLRRVAPELALWYDVVKRKSGYLEAGATVPVLALPLRSLGFMAYVGTLGGVALDTPEPHAELAATTFERTGLTQVELSAGFRVTGEKSLFGLLFNLAGHLQYARDDATRRKRLTPAELSSRVRPYVTFGLGLRWPPPADR